jgi:hypothetical protein
VKRRQQIHAFNAASAATAGQWERAAAVANRRNEGIWSDYRISAQRGSGPVTAKEELLPYTLA